MSLQARFSAALHDPCAPTPAGLIAWNGSDPAPRFAVYRNNGLASLVAALEETFPVVRALVGEGFFREMARVFVLAHPPVSPVLIDYGDALPDFIAGFAPAASLPYLPDVARLEALRVRAWHAADATSLSPADFETALQNADALPYLRLRLHPALTVLRSAHAVASLWAAHQPGGDIAGVDPAIAESVLIVRPVFAVDVIPVSEADARFIETLLGGAPLGEAVQDTFDHHPDFNPTQGLATLIARHAVCGLDTPPYEDIPS